MQGEYVQNDVTLSVLFQVGFLAIPSSGINTLASSAINPSNCKSLTPIQAPLFGESLNDLNKLQKCTYDMSLCVYLYKYVAFYKCCFCCWPSHLSGSWSLGWSNTMVGLHRSSGFQGCSLACKLHGLQIQSRVRSQIFMGPGKPVISRVPNNSTYRGEKKTGTHL